LKKSSFGKDVRDVLLVFLFNMYFLNLTKVRKFAQCRIRGRTVWVNRQNVYGAELS